MPSGIELAVHKPRIDDGPFLSADKPWEATVGSHGVVFEDEGVYRFYYRMRTRDGGDDGTHPMILAYAESTDGVTWTKPSIGTVELDGSTDNNLVYGLNVARGRSVNSASVFKDPTGGPNDRYKLLYRDPTERQLPNLYGAVSPDGLHWETLDEPLITNYFSDTHNVVGYDPKREGSTWPTSGVGRSSDRAPCTVAGTIAHAASDTFETWPRPQTIYAADALDGPDTDIYTNAYTPWPDADAFMMFPAFYQRNADIVEIQMLTGRDGVSYERLTREPMVPGGEPGTPSEGGYYAGSGSRELPAGRGLAANLRDVAHSQRGSLRRNADIRHSWRILVDRNMAEGRLRVAGGAGRGQLRDGAHHVRGRTAVDQRLDPGSAVRSASN